MAGSSLLIRNLLDTVKEEYFYHSKRVDQLKLGDYPFPWSSTLLTKLSEIDDAILRELDKLDKELQQTKKDPQTIALTKENLDAIQRYGQLVGVLHYVLTFFEIGHRQYLPEGTAVPIKNAIRLFDKSAAFVLVPIFEYNYIYLDLMKLLKTALQYALPDIEKIFSDMPGRYAVFGFPLIQKQNIISNTMLAHEVGHFVDEVAGLSDKILKRVTLDKKRIERIVNQLEKARVGERKEVRLTYFISPDTLRAEITKLAVSQISQWLKELVSDAVAFHLFGPVFLHSLSNFLLSMVEIDEASSDHPPPRMRIKLLLEEFKEKKYAEILKGVKETDDKKMADDFVSLSLELESILGTIKPGELTEFQELVMDSVQNVIPELKKEVNNYVISFEYRPEQFRDEVFQLSRRLDFIVPPAEIDVGKPALPVSILNAGLLYKMLLVRRLYGVFDAATSKDEIAVRDKLHALILKALELSDIETQMKQILKDSESA